MRDAGAVERLTKRTLVTVSHAIERAALAVAEDGPMVVIALFQRLPYFERERAVYQQISKLAAATVVGLVADRAPDLPFGPHTVLLDENEDLAREWTVAVLTPRFGAVLVARDREELEPTAATMESGRLFDSRWRFRRDDALHEVIRLRTVLDDRLPPAARAAIDDVVRRVRDLPSTPGETRGEASVRLFAEHAERAAARVRALRERMAAERAGRTDPAQTLLDDVTLGRWTGADAVTASGTLPVALLGVRVTHAQSLPERLGRRTAVVQSHGVITALTALLRPVDRAVRLADDEFLLVMPSLPYEAAVTLAHRVGTDVAALSGQYPYMSSSAVSVVAVTRQRPLPVAAIRDALAWAVREGVPVATLTDEHVGRPGR